jgi:hypothetical protein
MRKNGLAGAGPGRCDCDGQPRLGGRRQWRWEPRRAARAELRQDRRSAFGNAGRADHAAGRRPGQGAWVRPDDPFPYGRRAAWHSGRTARSAEARPNAITIGGLPRLTGGEAGHGTILLPIMKPSVPGTIRASVERSGEVQVRTQLRARTSLLPALVLAGVLALPVTGWSAETGSSGSPANPSGGIPAGQTGVGPKGTRVGPSTGNEPTASPGGASELSAGKTGVGPRGTKVGPSTGNRSTTGPQHSG